MTDMDESQASGSDYPDAQDLICTQQEEMYMLHEHTTNNQRKCSRSRQKGATPEESSVEVILDSSDSEMWVFIASLRTFQAQNLRDTSWMYVFCWK